MLPCQWARWTALLLPPGSHSPVIPQMAYNGHALHMRQLFKGMVQACASLRKEQGRSLFQSSDSTGRFLYEGLFCLNLFPLWPLLVSLL